MDILSDIEKSMVKATYRNVDMVSRFELDMEKSQKTFFQNINFWPANNEKSLNEKMLNSYIFYIYTLNKNGGQLNLKIYEKSASTTTPSKMRYMSEI